MAGNGICQCGVFCFPHVVARDTECDFEDEDGNPLVIKAARNLVLSVDERVDKLLNNAQGASGVVQKSWKMTFVCLAAVQLCKLADVA